MSQVSRNPLSKESNYEIQATLWWLLARLNNDSDVGNFLNGLLTKTEKIMLAKRLTVILLLDKGLPQHVISDELKVSISTVTRMSIGIDKGRYDDILKMSGKMNVLEILERIILMGMPPRVGRGRWNHWGRFTP